MNLSALEVAFYLTRFYDAIGNKTGYPVSKNGILSRTDDGLLAMTGKSQNGDVFWVTCSPMLVEYQHWVKRGVLSDGLRYLGMTVDGYIIVRLEEMNMCHGIYIPFKMTFDFQQDINHYLATLAKIEQVRFHPGRFSVSMEDEIHYRSDGLTDCKISCNS